MTSNAKTPVEYLKELPADRKEPVTKLREVVLNNLPKGFKETMSYGMLGYGVPHEIIRLAIIVILQCPCLLQLSITKKFYCFLSHGYLCHARSAGMVHERILKTKSFKIRYG